MKGFPKIGVYGILLMAVSLILISCQAPTKPLRVALLEWTPYELAFWARNQNWLDEQEITLLEYRTPAEVTRAYATGAVDIIAVTYDFALTLMADYPETRIFLVINISNGGDTVLSRTPVKSRNELIGKTIGTESAALGMYMLERFKNHYHLSDNDVNVQYVDISGQMNEWEKGTLDLLVTYEPNRSKLMAKGATDVFSSKDIPGEIVDVFLIREDVLLKRKKEVSNFITAWFKAVEDLHSNNSELFSYIGKREGLSPDVVENIFRNITIPSLQQNIAFLRTDTSTLIQGLTMNESVLTKLGMLNNVADKKTMITDIGISLVEEYHK